MQAKATNAYILRPPYFYGVYENLYREAFPFDCAMQDRPFYIPQNGDMKLQFFNVSDLCRFVEILIDKRPKDHVFNVGNKDIVTVKEWVEAIRQSEKLPSLSAWAKRFRREITSASMIMNISLMSASKMS